jgi:hypothetical protein
MIWTPCEAEDREAIRYHLGIDDRLTGHKGFNIAKRLKRLVDEHASQGGFAYFIQIDDYCKVGYSDDPRTRFHSINSHTPHECYLLGFVPGGKPLETALHSFLDDRHHKCEWYRLDQQLQLAIAILCYGHERVDLIQGYIPENSPISLFRLRPVWFRTPKKLAKSMVGGEGIEPPTFSV